MRYENILPNHKNANMGSSTVHLHCIDLVDMQIRDWLWRRIFILYKMDKYVTNFSWNIIIFVYKV